MGKDKLKVFSVFFITLVNFTIIHTCAMTFLGFFGKDVYDVPCLCLSCLGICLYLVREYKKNFLFFFVSHLMVAAVCLFVPHQDVWSHIIFMAEAAIIVGYSVYVKFSRKEQSDKPLTPVYAAVIILIMSILQYLYGAKALLNLYPWLMVIYILFYFLYAYMESYLKFIDTNKKVTGYIPKKEILLHGGGGACIFYSAVFLLLFGLIKSGLDISLRPIGQFFGRLFKVLFKGFIHLQVASDPEVIIPTDIPEEPILQGETHILSTIWQAVDCIIDFLKPIFFFCLMVVILFLMIQIIRRVFFHRTGKQTQIYSPQIMDVKEKIHRKKTAEKQKVFEYFGAAGRIRCLYKKAVSKSEQQGKEKSTARECMMSIFDKQELAKARMQFVALYEKARYSQDSCTKEDAARAGQLYRELMQGNK